MDPSSSSSDPPSSSWVFSPFFLTEFEFFKLFSSFLHMKFEFLKLFSSFLNMKFQVSASKSKDELTEILKKPVDPLVKSLICKSGDRLARSYLDKSQSMLAAATLIAVGDVREALILLELNGEPDLAFAVAEAFGEKLEKCIEEIAKNIARFDVEEALLMIQKCHSHPEEIMGKFIVVYSKNEIEANFWISKMKLKSLHW